MFSNCNDCGLSNIWSLQYFIENIAICSRIGFKASPLLVKEYSILTGFSLYTSLFIKPSFSISFSLIDNVFGLIFSIASRNSLKRFCFNIIIFRSINIANFFPIMLNVLLTGHDLQDISSNINLDGLSFNLPFQYLITNS